MLPNPPDDLRRVLNESATVPVKTAAAILNLSVQGTYNACRDGSVPSIKVGKRVLVPTHALRQMLRLDDNG